MKVCDVVEKDWPVSGDEIVHKVVLIAVMDADQVALQVVHTPVLRVLPVLERLHQGVRLGVVRLTHCDRPLTYVSISGVVAEKGSADPLCISTKEGEDKFSMNKQRIYPCAGCKGVPHLTFTKAFRNQVFYHMRL